MDDRPGFTHPRAIDRRALVGAGFTAPLLIPALARAQTAPPPSPSPETGTLLTRHDETTRRLTTPVLINGKGPFRFTIDTGANRSVMSVELARELGLSPGRVARVHGIAGAQDTPTVNIDSLRVGTIQLRLRDVPTLSAADMGTDGLLGLDVFHNRQVTFDFVHDLVKIERSAHPDTISWSAKGLAATDVVVRAVQRSGQLTIIDADAARVKIACFIDSGAQRSVGNMAMRAAVKARTGDRTFTPYEVTIFGATGQQVKGELAEVPAMRVGGVNFTRFSMAFADLHTFDLWGLNNKPALMIGVDLMSIFDTVSMDFGARLVRFRLSSLGIDQA